MRAPTSRDHIFTFSPSHDNVGSGWGSGLGWGGLGVGGSGVGVGFLHTKDDHADVTPQDRLDFIALDLKIGKKLQN